MRSAREPFRFEAIPAAHSTEIEMPRIRIASRMPDLAVTTTGAFVGDPGNASELLAPAPDRETIGAAVR